MKTKIFVALLLTSIFSCNKSITNQVSISRPVSILEKFTFKESQETQISVHRGGGYAIGYPENCIESFEKVSSQMPCIIECDVEMTRDSVMVLMHDKTLERTSTGKGLVVHNTFDEVKKYKLKDNFGNETKFEIPTLEKTLDWGKNKAIFTLDVKKTTPFKRVMEMVEKKNAINYAAIITYNLNEAVEVYSINPKFLISVSIMQEADYDRLHDAGIPDRNMLAFIGTREPKPDLINFLHKKGIMTILGVLGNLDKKAAAKNDTPYLDWINAGADILATDRPEAVYKVIQSISSPNKN